MIFSILLLLNNQTTIITLFHLLAIYGPYTNLVCPSVTPWHWPIVHGMRAVVGTRCGRWMTCCAVHLRRRAFCFTIGRASCHEWRLLFRARQAIWHLLLLAETCCLCAYCFFLCVCVCVHAFVCCAFCGRIWLANCAAVDNKPKACFCQVAEVV